MCKQLAVIAAVKADGDALTHGLLTLGLNDIGKCLCCVADDVDIHLVKAELHGTS